MRKIPFAGIVLTSQRVRKLHGYLWHMYFVNVSRLIILLSLELCRCSSDLFLSSRPRTYRIGNHVVYYYWVGLRHTRSVNVKKTTPTITHTRCEGYMITTGSDILIYENNHQVYVALFKSFISMKSSRITIDITGFLPSSAAASIYSFITAIRHRKSRVYRVTQLRTDGVHCRESAGTGPVNLKVVPNECCLAGHHGPINLCLSFPHPLLLV